jgi:hypothetical protein
MISLVVELGSLVPLRVLITDSFGFVVVCAREENRHYLLVYTVNGLLVRRTEIDGDVILWTKWTSLKGFDYIAFVTSKDNGDKLQFFACEVFYLNLSIFRCKTKSAVVTLKYVPANDLFMIAQEDGKITFYYQPNDGL